VHALAYHFDNLPMNSSERPGDHRIDKDTSGLLVIAKLKAAMTASCQIEAKPPEREYVALVWGNVEEGTIEGNLASLKDRMQMAVFAS
jgi:23S rRNA pseudouridine1911/1915/1917 synthase